MRLDLETVVTLVSLVPLAFLQTASAQSCVPAPPNLISWWPGDGNANDIINGNSGALQNGATFATGFVTSGNGQAFNFTLLGPPPSQAFMGQYVEVPTNPSLDLVQVTVDAWIETTFLPPPLTAQGSQFSAPVFIVDKSGLDGLDGYQLFYRGVHPTNTDLDGIVNFLVRAGGGSAANKGTLWDVATGTTNVADGNWHHLTGTYDGQQIKVYVDGNLEGTTAYTGGMTYDHPAPGPLRLSGRQWPSFPNGYYEGVMDEVEIYNRSLSSAEIQAIFNAGSAGKCKIDCQQAALDLADAILALDLSLFNGPNNNANSGRRGSLANSAAEAADSFALGDVDAAFELLTSLLKKIDGQSPPLDWMVDSPEKSDLADAVNNLISLCG